MNNLKNYEEQTYPSISLPDLYDGDDEKVEGGLKVDEVDSIRKLIENISLTKKWPTRRITKKNAATTASPF